MQTAHLTRDEARANFHAVSIFPSWARIDRIRERER